MNESFSGSTQPITHTSEPSPEVKITIKDPTIPHNNPDNLFAFDPEQLSVLVDPKNLPLLHTFGGLQGIARGLHADLVNGLSPHELVKNPITLADINTQLELKLQLQPVLTNKSTGSGSGSKGTGFTARTAIFGTNILPPAKVKTIFELMWMAMKDKTLILLTVAAIVSLAVGIYDDIDIPEVDAMGNTIPGVKWVEGVAIMIAVIIVVSVGSANDYQKEKQFRKLNAKKEDRFVKATREKNTLLISVHDIQVGDVLHLEPGDIVAADGIFIEGHNLRCDESAATGESDAVRKQAWEVCYRLMKQDERSEGSISEKNVNVHKSSSDPFIISGSKVLEGVCTYLVTSVGVHSYYGRTMMALRTDPETTPLQEKLNHLAETIAKLGSAAGLLMLVVLLIRYFVKWRYGVPSPASAIVQGIMNIIIVVVTIVVVAVPEGLPLAVTLALAYATQRMLKDNNLVRVLAACETMGNATTVCSDKTGTLTQNKMSVVAGTFGSSFRFIKEVPLNRKDLHDITAVGQKAPRQILNLLNQGIAVNSSAFESVDDNGAKVLVGNKTETALLEFGQGIGSEDIEVLRTRWNIAQVFPFSSDRKAMATVIRIPHPTKTNSFIYRAHVKGAPEILVNKCSTIITLQDSQYAFAEHDYDVKTRKLNTEDMTRVVHIIQSYASRSLRTIGIAYRDFEQWPPFSDTPSSSDPEEEIEIPFDEIVRDNGLTLLGIVGIEDPLRPGVTEAVKACQRAGVFVRMVTGDNMMTAKSIAKQCGIYTQGGIVMEGPVFRNLPTSEMDAILPRLQVLARSSPQDKQILVGRLKELGDIVAVTGDGTNDGPALKLADVGFSMGISGTEVAKEASSIILMDDNFSSIVKAIMWGRCVNDAVKKFLEFQLTVNVTAVILTFISSVVSDSQDSVLTAVQLLWVNLIMDTFAALALATDPPTEELLLRGPESRSSPLITFKMWKMIIGQAIFQVVVTIVMLYSDIFNYDPASGILQTLVFNTFVFCQLFNEINCRSIDDSLNIFHNILANKFFMFIFGFCVMCQAIIVNFGGTAFQVTRIGGVEWAISIVIGLISIPIGVIIRLIPDRIFMFLFRNPTSRQRYFGVQNSGDMVPPSVYVAGNERFSWSHTHKQHNGLQSFKRKSLDRHSMSEKVQVSQSSNIPDIAPQERHSHEEENQDTIMSYTSREIHN
ncbi:PMCA-type calcium-translocating P-type ATPase [Phycomyces nitens]|nr:PMCA-type calcium-translocating P-type ATPase [Phycomyces nitens]